MPCFRSLHHSHYREVNAQWLRLAIDEVDVRAAFPFVLDCLVADPGGLNAHYVNVATSMLTDGGLTHVVGCYTSSSRKEVQPYFEKYDGLLWYPSHYEGFESCENTVYTGASPNKHIIPLANFLIKHHGAIAYFIGSNYIWAWENNKIMREAVLAAGGAVLAERYAPVAEHQLLSLSFPAYSRPHRASASRRNGFSRLAADAEAAARRARGEGLSVY